MSCLGALIYIVYVMVKTTTYGVSLWTFGCVAQVSNSY
jgi:hypothetical protein